MSAAPRSTSERADRVRRVAVAVLAVVAVVAVVVARRAPGEPAAAAPTPHLGTPLWSARRVAQPVVDAVGQARLTAALAAAAAGTSACYAVDDAAGGVVTAAADQPLIPASTQKLLTATAALARLGPDFRYETRASAPTKVQGGTLDRLFLVGAGDPLITTPEAAAVLAQDPAHRGDALTPLADLADALVAAGVRRIPGGIVADDSRYDDVRYVAAWPDSYRADREIGPIGALTVNHGFTGPAGQGPAAADPARNAADELARLLTARGVAVGPSSRGRAPADATTVATLRSPPLAAVLTELLASSDNLTAEMVAKELAAQQTRPGTTAAGTAAIERALTDLGLPTAGMVMVDGSGLARQNRATCALLLAALGLASEPRFATLHDGLAIAGERGTLATRLRGTPLAGTLRAKTGSLSGVTGLAGFLAVTRPVTFALLANGAFGESGGVALRERMARAIAEYPDAPAPEVLVPAPLAAAPAVRPASTAPSTEACPSSSAAC